MDVSAGNRLGVAFWVAHEQKSETTPTTSIRRGKVTFMLKNSQKVRRRLKSVNGNCASLKTWISCQWKSWSGAKAWRKEIDGKEKAASPVTGRGR